jgi:predicted metal-dependent hydrolase
LRLQARATGAVLVVPMRVSIAQALAFLHAQSDWLRHHMARLAAEAPREIPVNRFTLLGEPLGVTLTASVGKSRTGVLRLADRLYVRVPGADPRRGQAVLEAWLREEARRRLEDMSLAWAPRLGVSVERVRIAAQRTRWGSCSATGTISYNWRAVLLPTELAEYLVVHELAHRREMNHSNRFWRVVAEHFPRYEEARDRLRELGPLLTGEWIRLAPEPG